MWIIFAALNPLADSLRSLFSKKASLSGTDPLLLSWMNNIVPIIVFLPVPFFVEFTFSKEYFYALAGTGITNIFALIFYMKAISAGEISLVVPILSFTPLFMIITSPIMTGETPGPIGIAGIIFIVIGSYILNLNPKRGNFLTPIKNLFKNTGTRYMLFVAVILSLSANFDKLAINSSSVYQHVFLVNIFIFAGVSMIVFIKRKMDINSIYHQKKNLLLVGLFTALAYVFHMSALSLTLAAYVVAIKRTNGFFSVLFGHFFLNEKNIKERFIGSFIMFIGVLIILLA